MKKLLLLLALLIGFMAYAQQEGDSTLKQLKKKEYKTTINSVYRGYLVHLTDSSLTVSSSRYPFGNNVKKENYFYHQIDNVEILSAGRPLRAALVGAVVGLVSGGALGLAVGSGSSLPAPFQDPITTAAYTVSGAALGVVTGTVTGIIIGKLKHKFQVNRDREQFKRFYASIAR